MGVKEVEWDGFDWIHLSQDSDQRWGLLNMIINW
jgi:hypothetical protein